MYIYDNDTISQKAHHLQMAKGHHSWNTVTFKHYNII